MFSGLKCSTTETRDEFAKVFISLEQFLPHSPSLSLVFVTAFTIWLAKVLHNKNTVQTKQALKYFLHCALAINFIELVSNFP